ncbi:unnamed protein product [Fraxinus pennsylvanica]|uniref:Uncharacterized protein n=1 Tax=Fraxinus pennsylvanica TaxID=56036 RepID=A0AAD2A1M3_9LAMI|nr:unnamed protein product [Fraxinus pennsylvanica]
MQPPPLPKSNLPVLYYGVFIIGTAAIVLVVYNLIKRKWFTGYSNSRPRQGTIHGFTSSFGDPRINSMTSFKYRKHGLEQDKDQDICLYSHSDCPLCRSLVERTVPHRNIPGSPSEYSREGLLQAGIV